MTTETKMRLAQYYRAKDYWVVKLVHHNKPWLEVVLRSPTEEGARQMCVVLNMYGTSFDVYNRS